MVIVLLRADGVDALLATARRIVTDFNCHAFSSASDFLKPARAPEGAAAFLKEPTGIK